MLLIDKLGRERERESCHLGQKQDDSCAIEAGEFGLMDPMVRVIQNLRISHKRGSACNFVERNSDFH